MLVGWRKVSNDDNQVLTYACTYGANLVRSKGDGRTDFEPDQHGQTGEIVYLREWTSRPAFNIL